MPQKVQKIYFTDLNCERVLKPPKKFHGIVSIIYLPRSVNHFRKTREVRYYEHSYEFLLRGCDVNDLTKNIEYSCMYYSLVFLNLPYRRNW